MTTLTRTPELTDRISKLLQSEYRPKQIADLKQQIDGETRALELRHSCGQEVTEEQILTIVMMKRRLDNLYWMWATGEIE